ncbi:uncharacterized protein HGUI_03441 [Hanseniaspora guilliermondii]|uniref:GDP-mannose transporter n=1 Tax=Hanseniaspora guilliermondii TaxID=56406 RepID=A0A1L0CRS0_9ASCO|nr:uncharacterized protein HGUI_03441 [Hanseniaspora guilliermondii]
MGFKTKIALLTIGWYFSSILLSIYNKHVISKLQIPYPLLMTSIHQILLYFISLLYIWIKNKYMDHSEDQARGTNKIPWMYRLPVAVFTALDIGFSNLSLKYIALTIYLVIKTSSIAFVLLFSVMFRLERYDWKLGMIVIVMMLGVCGMTYFQDDKRETSPHENERRFFMDDTWKKYDCFSDMHTSVKNLSSLNIVNKNEFHVAMVNRRDDAQLVIEDGEESNKREFIIGVILVLGSAILGGLRWVITQLILRNTVKKVYNNDHEEHKTQKKNPIKTIKQLAPISSLVLFITSMIIERPSITHFINEICFENPTSFLYQIKGFMMLLIPGMLVFGLTLSEYNILQKTNSSLTLSILGILKEVVTILVSMLVLKERLSHGFGQWISMLVIIGDAIVYNFYKVLENKKLKHSVQDEENGLIEQDELQIKSYTNVMGGLVESIELEEILSNQDDR